jgi:hypothetical protein
MSQLQASGSRQDDAKLRLSDNPSKFLKPQLGLFHVKIAGARATVNEHWGKPNSSSPWSLWRMNALLARKMIPAGWKAKTQAPLRPIMELMLKLVLPANILDAFRICSEKETLLEWISGIKEVSEVDSVARRVLAEHCSARRVSRLRTSDSAQRDVPLENTILFNRMH